MLVGGAVGGGAVGEVDWVCGGEGEGVGVEVYGCGVVFLRHGSVALGFETFGFGGCGGNGWCWFWCVGSGCGCAATTTGRVFAL